MTPAGPRVASAAGWRRGLASRANPEGWIGPPRNRICNRCRPTLSSRSVKGSRCLRSRSAGRPARSRGSRPDCILQRETFGHGMRVVNYEWSGVGRRVFAARESPIATRALSRLLAWSPTINSGRSATCTARPVASTARCTRRRRFGRPAPPARGPAWPTRAATDLVVDLQCVVVERGPNAGDPAGRFRKNCLAAAAGQFHL